MIITYSGKRFMQEAKEILNSCRTDNEALLDNIIEMLSNKSFSRILESKYKKKYIFIQEMVKKSKDIDINSNAGEKFLLKIYRNLKNILNETHIKINFHRQKRDQYLNYKWWNDITFQGSSNLDLKDQDYFEWHLLEDKIIETEQIYLKILSKKIKNNDHRVKSFNFGELKSIFIVKQNIDLEKLRGRAPGNLIYIS